jgi:DNA-binding GntR family transcriptional regulator
MSGITHLPLRHAVLAELRRRITEGQWQQGERLFEDQIATELEVSRNPVREALQALAAEGFVELEPRRGARVATVSTARALELFEVRETLEGLVAQLAAERRTEEELASLRDVVRAGRESALGDHARLPALNTEFHQLVGVAARNGLLAETIERLAHVIQWVYAHSIAQRGEQSWAEHAAIVEAIAERNGTLARALATEHIARAKDAYLGTAQG